MPNVYPRAASASAVSFNWRLALSSIAIGCAYLAASWHVSGPAYLRDEIGYLANAAFLTNHRIDAASSFHAGYSFLIAPAFLFSGPNCRSTSGLAPGQPPGVSSRDPWILELQRGAPSSGPEWQWCSF